MEYSEVTSNMVGPSAAPNKSKRKQLAISSKEFNAEHFSSLKEIPTESEGIYQYTRIQTGVITLVNSNLLAKGIEKNDEHSAIAESRSFNSYVEKEAFTYMINTPEEMTRRFEEQSQMQKEQQDMLRVQQEFINNLKKMIVLLFYKKKSKGSKTSTSSSKSKRK